jgi:DNA-binding PadR family transcriptional regulator
MPSHLEPKLGSSDAAQRTPESLLPLKHSSYQVLLALESGEKHGYGIMLSLSTLTSGRERILPGTLYASLARMVSEGLVEELEAPENDWSGGPKRRYYRRTEFGRAVAAAESERLRALLDIAEAQDLVTR